LENFLRENARSCTEIMFFHIFIEIDSNFIETKNPAHAE